MKEVAWESYMLARSATTGRRTFGGLGKDLRSTSSGKSGWFGQCSGCQHGHCARHPSGPEPRAEANAQEDERPRDPTIWASDADWQDLAVVLVNRNICELIEFNDIAEGQRLEGTGRSDGGRESWQRSQYWPPASHHEHQSAQLGSECHRWRHATEDGETLVWSGEDLKCCFYVFEIP